MIPFFWQGSGSSLSLGLAPQDRWPEGKAAEPSQGEEEGNQATSYQAVEKESLIRAIRTEGIRVQPEVDLRLEGVSRRVRHAKGHGVSPVSQV